MNAKRVAAAAGVIHDSQARGLQTAAGLAADLESACSLQSPETAAELVAFRGLELGDLDGRVSACCGEPNHPTWLRRTDDTRGCPWCVMDLQNEALSDAAEALRENAARIAELERREAIVAAFVAKRAEYVSNLRNCNPDNGPDYDRWQGHAAARRQLAQELGLPVAWPESDAQVADKLTALLAPTQALQLEGEHYAAVHHDYRNSRDLDFGGQR